MSSPHEPNENSTAPSPGIILILQELDDPRIERARKHHLSDILFIALCAVICGGESFEDMEEFGKAKLPWLRQHLELPNGIPSHDTFNRVGRKNGQPLDIERGASPKHRGQLLSYRRCCVENERWEILFQPDVRRAEVVTTRPHQTCHPSIAMLQSSLADLPALLDFERVLRMPPPMRLVASSRADSRLQLLCTAM